MLTKKFLQKAKKLKSKSTLVKENFYNQSSKSIAFYI